MSTNFEDLIGRGVTGSKPAAGVPGRLYFDTTVNKLYRDNGSTWDEIEGTGGEGISTNSGALGSLPAAGNTGDLYLATDAPFILRDDGAAWDVFGPIYPLTPPDLDDFTWVNQGTATAVETNGGIFIQAPAEASMSWRMLMKSAPSTPYTITALIIPNLAHKDYQAAGLIFRESSTGKLHICGFLHSTNFLFDSNKKTNETTDSAQYTFETIYNLRPMWLRIQDTGTDRIFSWSLDGWHFQMIHTIARADFLTANQVGFGVASINANYQAGLWVLSWLES